ncbi:MAG TPA: winged helix-turn-helix domain-containing protein [Pyrinomonadaceae bacterium]|nr:winged helix-turn-helix domain-containing protein [Pyrinomonadaceae bacterium]
MLSKSSQSYEFEGYRLDVQPAGLWRDGELISLPPKVLEMLILLVEKKGEIVTTDELLDRIWPDTHVEEGNIKYTISLLRKSLGRELVQTIPRRGYRFVAEVSPAPANGKQILQSPAVNEALPPRMSVSNTTRGGHALADQRSSRRILFAGALILALTATGIGFWWKFWKTPASVTVTGVKSLAVLPLKTLSDDEASRAVSFGLTSSLISRLGSLNRFIVRPLDAVESYAKSGNDALKFAERLKVDSVLEGTIQTIDKRIKVNIRLLDVRTGGQVWTASFVESEDDVFKLQDKLAAQVANSLVTRMTRQEESLLASKSTNNAEAYRAYVRGRAILDRKNSDLLERAIDEFQRSLTLDPAYALAYAGLADAFLARTNLMSNEEATDAFEKAERYAQKALELGEESAEVYTALGRVKRLHRWDWEGAEKDFRRAIQVNPNQAEAHRYLAQMLSFLGRQDEAIIEINNAIEINPISPSITMAQFSILESRGEYAKGMKRAEEFFRLEKANPLAKRAVATFSFHLGDHARVIDIGEHLTNEDERFRFAFLSLVSSSYQKTHQAERADETLRQLEQLAQSDTKALYSLAVNYAELGRTDDAVWALQKCFEQREERVVWINVEPRLANIRSDARVQDLVRRLRLA